jgi:hypothetical protein
MAICPSPLKITETTVECHSKFGTFTHCDYVISVLLICESSNLSFQYPGSKSTRKALTDVSFSVKSGQLVVIVGANGSGKSTVVKMLNRLYNPASGEILVDDQPMSSYRISDLRQATADLSQDNCLYPLSIRENIGLGHPQCMSDLNMITESAELGGALDFVSELEQGFDTTLQPVRTAYMGRPNEGDGHPLKEIFDKLEKQVDISGACGCLAESDRCPESSYRRRKTAAGCVGPI